MQSFLFIASALITSIVAAPQPSEQPQLQRRLLGALFGGNGIAAVDAGGLRVGSPESDSFKFTYDAGYGNWHGPKFVPAYSQLFGGGFPGFGAVPFNGQGGGPQGGPQPFQGQQGGFPGGQGGFQAPQGGFPGQQ